MAQRATSLGPKPALFIYSSFCFFFLSFLCFNRKTQFSHLKRAFFCLFLVFLFLSPFAFFGLPLFQFLCLSVVLFFLPSFLSFFLLSFCFLFLSLSFLFFFFAFVSWKEQHQNIQLQLFFLKYFLFFWFPVLFSVWSLFFLSLLFPDFKLCFCSTSMFLVSNNQIEKHTCLVKKGGCNKTFFLWACVLQNVKSYRFFCPLFAKFWLMFTKHYKNRYFSTF